MKREEENDGDKNVDTFLQKICYTMYLFLNFDSIIYEQFLFDK